MMADCRAAGMDVWIDEFTVDRCINEDENHEVSNVLWCVDSICNNADYHDEWDDTDIMLKGLYPECRVDMKVTVNGNPPSAASRAFLTLDVFYTMVTGVVLLLIASL